MFGLGYKIAVGTGIALLLAISALFITRHTLSNRTVALAVANGLLIDIGTSASSLAGDKHTIKPEQVPVFIERFRAALIEGRAKAIEETRKEELQRQEISNARDRSLRIQLDAVRDRLTGVQRAAATGAYRNARPESALPGVSITSGGFNGAPLIVSIDVRDAAVIESDRRRHNQLIDWVQDQLAVKRVQ